MSFPPATEMFQFAGFAAPAYGFSRRYLKRGGLPHSEISGSMSARNSPELIAACYVLHRLSVPRHSPDALIALDLALPSCTENKPVGSKPSAISRQLSANQLTPHTTSHANTQLPKQTPNAGQARQTASAVRIKKTSLHNGKEPKQITQDRCQTTDQPSPKPMAGTARSTLSNPPAIFRPLSSDFRLAGSAIGRLGDWQARQLVGPGRLELPTLRLSGVRSNHLSYGPPSANEVSAGFRMERRSPAPLAQLQAGGAERDRTDDLLLAKQALSQLSYSPSANEVSASRRQWLPQEAARAACRRMERRSAAKSSAALQVIENSRHPSSDICPLSSDASRMEEMRRRRQPRSHDRSPKALTKPSGRSLSNYPETKELAAKRDFASRSLERR